MALRTLTRTEVGLIHELIGDAGREDGGLLARARAHVEALPPVWGGIVLGSVVVGLFASAIAGLLFALAEAGSVLASISGAAVMLGSAAVASHLTPGRIPPQAN